MARKSRMTIWRERLAEVSSSPFDLFDLYAPDEALIDRLSLAESGDVQALRAIISHIYSFVSAEENLEEARLYKNDALIYWCERCIKTNDGDLNRLVTEALLTVGYGLSLAEQALAAIDDGTVRERLTPSVTALQTLNMAAEGCGPDALLPLLSRLDKTDFADLWVFALASCRGDRPLDGRVKDALSSLGLSVLLTLPCFGRTVAAEVLDGKEASRVLSDIEKISKKYFHPAWADFWLVCSYEFCREYLGDYTAIAGLAAEVTGGRHFSARRNLHALAWISYLAENGPEGEERESLTAQARRLEELSRFELLLEGEADADTLAALREEAIYTSSVKERRAHERELPFGNRIIHERNRYHLSASLTGHSKRGSRHYWETVISLCLDGGEPFTPEIDTLTVDGAFNAASRGGVTLPQDKFSSQVILSSEIGLNGVRSPLSVDLILDIAYISAVKCGSCEIKVSGTEYIDGWAVMDCQVYLY